MKISKFCRGLRRGSIAAAAAGMLLLPSVSPAFPPAPSHLIYGQVRDQYGVPLTVTNALIFFEPTNGASLVRPIIPNLEPGVNYRLDVSVDSGIAPDPYKVSALEPMVSFRMRVKIGATTYLPMEMAAQYSRLGQPAESTRINLTLGVDADGDGLPDAWQQLLLAMLGPGARIGPNDDADGDGISNLNEYLAGTYAFDPADGLRLNLLSNANGQPLLEFMVVAPRSYAIFGSTNLQSWEPLQFKVPADGPNAPSRPLYRAADIRILRIEPILPADQPASQFYFKAQVQ